MKGKSFIPLIAGLCIGGFALKIGLDTIKRAHGAPTATVDVWAASVDIPRGTAIGEEMLKTFAFPAKQVPPGVITQKADIIGRVPRTLAPAGLPLLDSLLLPPGAKAGLWVKPGYRAVAVRIDEGSGVDNHLVPGCHVDLVGYFKIRSQGQMETVARTLIENAEVAAVGARLSAGGQEEEAAGGDKPARAVTLFVKPAQVPQLHLAEQMGKIKLCMRNDDDANRASLSSLTTEQDVLGTAKPTPTVNPLSSFMQMFQHPAQTPAVEEPEPLPPIEQAPLLAVAATAPPWTIVVWNGDNKEVLNFKSIDSMEPAEPRATNDALTATTYSSSSSPTAGRMSSASSAVDQARFVAEELVQRAASQEEEDQSEPKELPE
ncbi:MAG: Flp pilus assembly protein CpaB [Planctomycetes bacterium]|nr:Flp pilus assembly protein CpaB [Planctomycetota bacterium]